MIGNDRAIVVGSGLAGLHAACRLARRGVETTLVEKRGVVGGYCSNVEVSGHRFDIGATMLHTPEVLRDCFEELGRDVENYLKLIDLDPLYSVRFPSGESIELRRGVEATAESIRELSPRDADGFLRYAADLGRLKSAFKALLIEHRYGSALRSISGDPIRLLGILGRVGPWRSVDALMRSYFSSELVRAAFSFQVYYLGVAPSACPAAYGMVPYFEVTKGVWHVEGGLGQIASALLRIFLEEGGHLEVGREVERIVTSRGSVRGVRFRDGETLVGGRVISSAETLYTLTELLARDALSWSVRRRISRSKPSCSPLVTLMGVDATRVDLVHHHTFFMPCDIPAASRSIFESPSLPPDYCSYACYPSLTDPTLAPAGRGSLYVLTPVSREAVGDWSAFREGGPRYAADGLGSRGVRGLRSSLEPHIVLDPAYYENEFNQPGGMGFGVRPSIGQLGPLRFGPRVAGVRGLYVAGASTNPGAGVPLVLASGRSAANAVVEDLARAA